MSQNAETQIQPRPVFYQEFVPQVAPLGSFWIRVSDSALFYYSGDTSRGILGWVRIFENVVPPTGFSGDLIRYRVAWEDPDLVQYASTETYETGLLKVVGDEVRSVIVTSTICITTTTTPTTTTTTTPITTTTTTPTTTTTTTTVLAPVSGYVLWLKADSIAGADGDPVSLWEDQSAGNHDAAQATSGFRPTLQTNEINGFPIVRFDGSNDLLTIPDHADLDLTGDQTIFAVIKTLADSGCIMTHINSSAPYIGWGVGLGFGPVTVDGQPVYYSADSSPADWVAATTRVDDGNPHILTFRRSGITLDHFKDGVADGTHTVVVNTASNESVGIGAYGWPSPANFLAGDIAEIIVYNSALSSGDRGIVESYLAAKYGL